MQLIKVINISVVYIPYVDLISFVYGQNYGLAGLFVLMCIGMCLSNDQAISENGHMGRIILIPMQQAEGKEVDSTSWYDKQALCVVVAISFIYVNVVKDDVLIDTKCAKVVAEEGGENYCFFRSKIRLRSL